MWKGKNSGCIAIFPRIAATVGNPYHCQSYEIVGEHGACEPSGLIRSTRPATRSEYRDTAKVLRRRGYRLAIRQRLSDSDLRERIKQLNAI